MLRVICSGAYRNNGEMNDFSDFEIIMPDCPEDWIQMNATKRCFVRQAEKKFKKRVDSIHSLYIDKVEPLKDKDEKIMPSCCGKKIKSLGWEELQDLAIMFCLREVPTYRSGDLRSARIIAYRTYGNKILGKDYKDGFDFAAAPDFTVPNEVTVRGEYKGNLEKVIANKFD